MVVYLWISEFKNLKEIEFNFTSKYKVNFDKSKMTLEISRNTNYIENFFGQSIENITCIVGENGTGKSNVLEYLISCFLKSKEVWNKQHIIIGEDENLIKIFYPKEFENIKFINNELIKGELFPYIDARDIKIIDNIQLFSNKIVFYSNLFDGKQRTFQRHFDSFNVKDISTNGILLNEDFFSGKKTNLVKNNISAYRVLEILKQLTFFSEWDRNLTDLIRFPDLIRIYPSSSFGKESFREIPFIRGNKIGDEILQKLSVIDLKLQARNPFETLTKEVIFCLFYENFYLGISGALEALNALYLRLSKKSNFEWEEIIKIVSKNFVLEKEFEQIIALLKELPTSENSWVDIPFKEIEKFRYLFLIDRILLLQLTYPFEFEWKFKGEDSGELSAGENAFITLFSRINSVRSESASKTILILDEADLALHPEWQRKFVDNLIRVISLVNPSIKQIIISTHSPFILSDLPNKNVIYLKKAGGNVITLKDNQKPNSFGANIHQLLSDSFFLNNGLIGEFAKTKIQKMFEYLNEENNNEKISNDEFEKLLPLIGEPLISSKLAEMYAIKVGKDPEIARLRDIRNKIDQQLKNLEKDDPDKE